MHTIRLLFAGVVGLAALGQAAAAADDASVEKPTSTLVKTDAAKLKDWRARWEQNATAAARNRNCDRELGEEIGWRMMPVMEGFYYGYVATKDTKWVDMLIDWTDSWFKRAVKEPDGYPGWPKLKAAGTDVDRLDSFNADSLLGEAMALRPVLLLSAEILKTPALREKYGEKAKAYIAMSEQIYQKWNARGAWRETANGGMITVVLPFGRDGDTGQWTAGYAQRNAPGQGFSHPDNKANHVARWLLAMYDATQKSMYKVRAEKWFRLMKSRMKLKDDGTYAIWNYWEPAGPWDYKPNGSPKHWVGVHPRAGYYSIDTEGIIDAYEHALVFTKADIDRLAATALAQKRYWFALAPYNQEIQKAVEQRLRPGSWGGLSGAAHYLALQARLSESER